MKASLVLLLSWALSLFGGVVAEVVLQPRAQSCVELVTTTNSSVLGSACFQLSPTQDEVVLDLDIGSEEWELSDVRFKAQSKASNTSTLYHFGDLRQAVSLDLSADLHHECSSEGGLSLTAAFEAKAKRKQGQNVAWKTMEFQKIEITLPCDWTAKSQLRRRTQYEVVKPIIEPCPAYPTSTFYNLSKDFIQQAYEGINLIDMMENESVDLEDMIATGRKKYATFEAWGDIDDEALVAKTNDTNRCHAVFRGTDIFNMYDQFQNIAFLNERIDGTDCVVRQGYKDAYFTAYLNTFRTEVENCVASCEGGCPLVLSGHSQGGAAAVVASIDLRAYNPTVITFGAPRAIHDDGDPCTAANSSNHYRFINTLNNQFDRVPSMGSVFNAKHIGHTFLLDDGNFHVVGTGLNDDQSRTPWTDLPHFVNIYKRRIQAMVNRGCYPVPVAKWSNDHFCGRSDECEDDSFCLMKRCRPKPFVTLGSLYP